MTKPRWRASFTRSRPNSSITGIIEHRRKTDAISSPLGHRLYQPDRDGAKSSLTLSIFSGEDQCREGEPELKFRCSSVDVERTTLHSLARQAPRYRHLPGLMHLGCGTLKWETAVHLLTIS